MMGQLFKIDRSDKVDIVNLSVNSLSVSIQLIKLFTRYIFPLYALRDFYNGSAFTLIKPEKTRANCRFSFAFERSESRRNPGLTLNL